MDGGFVTAAQRLCKYSVVGSHYPHQLPQKLTRRSDQAAEAPKKKKKKKSMMQIHPLAGFSAFYNKQVK